MQIKQYPDSSMAIIAISKNVQQLLEYNISTETDIEAFLKKYDNYTNYLNLVNGDTGETIIHIKKFREQDSVIIGRTLHPLTYVDINGEEIKIIDNENRFLLCFWDRYCANCIVELKLLNSIAREFPDIKIIAITTDKIDDTKNFMEAKGLTWKNLKVVSGYKKEYLPIIQSNAQPLSILTSKTGVIEKIYYGSRLRQMIVDMDAVSAKKE